MAFKLRNEVGILGEQVALRLYLNQGYKLVARNLYNPKGKRFGEIDIIVERSGIIVFVEVKARMGNGFGNPAESVHCRKQQRLVKTVEWFLCCNVGFQRFQPRIDVCLVELSPIDKSVKSVKILVNAVTLDY